MSLYFPAFRAFRAAIRESKIAQQFFRTSQSPTAGQHRAKRQLRGTATIISWPKKVDYSSKDGALPQTFPPRKTALRTLSTIVYVRKPASEQSCASRVQSRELGT